MRKQLANSCKEEETVTSVTHFMANTDWGLRFLAQFLDPGGFANKSSF